MPHTTYPLSPPILGIATSFAIDQIPDGFAENLCNIFPEDGRLKLRGGVSKYHDLAVSSAVESLYTLTLANGTQKLVGAANNVLSDIQDGSATAITGTTTPTSDKWQGVNFANRLYLANGADTVQVWTGSGNFANAGFTGVTLSSLINVSIYKERIYFVEKDSTSIWYGGLQSVTGSLTEIDFGYFLKKGGYIVACGSWTNQIANTLEDLFWVISSEGEILFYTGSYPGDAAWSLIARSFTGKPLGYRCGVDVENDTYLITSAGILPIQAIINGGSVAAADTFSKEINPLIRLWAKGLPFSSKWNGLYWPQGRRFYLTVPFSELSTFMLVCNLETNAWCKYEITNDTYTNGQANQPTQLSLLNDRLYAGSFFGLVCKYESGFADGNLPIGFKIKYAPNYFGARDKVKKFSDIRPLMLTTDNVSMDVGIDVDFVQTAILESISTGEGGGTPWGSPWGSPWSEEQKFFNNRYSISGLGHVGSVRLEGSVKGTSLEINTVEIGYELGGRI